MPWQILNKEIQDHYCDSVRGLWMVVREEIGLVVKGR